VFISRRSEGLKWRGVALAGALFAAGFVAAPERAQAEGLFDFLFGGLHRQTVPAPVTSYAPAPALSDPESSRHGGGAMGGNTIGAGGGGRFVAFCVRLCDGQHFPLDHNTNATPIETCRSMCPTAKTKIFFGNEIDHAVAHDGAHYADLDNAYVYRDHLVPSCTCNGKDSFGLTAIEAKNDPTLRPGDIVSTGSGLMAYAGKRGGHVAEFTPVDASTLAALSGTQSSRVRVSERATEPPVVEEEPGIIVPPQAAGQGDLRGQSAR
jgi:hypothetical protein